MLLLVSPLQKGMKKQKQKEKKYRRACRPSLPPCYGCRFGQESSTSRKQQPCMTERRERERIQNRRQHFIRLVLQTKSKDCSHQDLHPLFSRDRTSREGRSGSCECWLVTTHRGSSCGSWRVNSSISRDVQVWSRQLHTYCTPP